MSQSTVFTALMIAVVVAGIVLLISILAREGISSAQERVVVRTVVPEPDVDCKRKCERSGWSGSGGSDEDEAVVVPCPKPKRKKESNGWLWFVIVIVFTLLIGGAVYVIFFKASLPRGVVSYTHSPLESQMGGAGACGSCRLPGVRSTSVMSQASTVVDPLPPVVMDTGRMRASLLPARR